MKVKSVEAKGVLADLLANINEKEYEEVKKEMIMEDYKIRYEEALERAKEKYAMFKGMKQGDVLEDVFPELKELEDERIRKAIIDFFGEPGRKEYILNGFNVDDIVAWLERQGEQKPVEFCEEDERVRSAISIYLDWLDGRNDCAPRGEYSIRDMVVWLEKQGEQKLDWSEEDERNLKKAVWYVENPAPNVVKDIMLSEWLKSLKARCAWKL